MRSGLGPTRTRMNRTKVHEEMGSESRFALAWHGRAWHGMLYHILVSIALRLSFCWERNKLHSWETHYCNPSIWNRYGQSYRRHCVALIRIGKTKLSNGLGVHSFIPRTGQLRALCLSVVLQVPSSASRAFLPRVPNTPVPQCCTPAARERRVVFGLYCPEQHPASAAGGSRLPC